MKKPNVFYNVETQSGSTRFESPTLREAKTVALELCEKSGGSTCFLTRHNNDETETGRWPLHTVPRYLSARWRLT